MINKNYIKFIKPIIDASLTIVGIILMIPILIIIVILTLVVYCNPIFYKQNRPGINNKIIKLIKFRTMTNNIDSNGVLLPDEQRLTKFGRFLRSTSLDELPELINVLRGDMSLVGPRPLLEEYLPLYSKEQARRHEVKPGITGWAQVNGRNEILNQGNQARKYVVENFDRKEITIKFANYMESLF